MTPQESTTKETNTTPPPAFDTPQEVGQWLVENDQALSKIEDAIMAADPSDTPTQEFLLIHHELGNVTGMLRAAVLAAQPAIERIEALKAKHGI